MEKIEMNNLIDEIRKELKVLKVDESNISITVDMDEFGSYDDSVDTLDRLEIISDDHNIDRINIRYNENEMIRFELKQYYTKMKIVEKSLNFYYDSPTVNGHVFSRTMLFDELERIKTEKIPVYARYSDEYLLKDIIGFAKEHIDHRNHIIIEIEIVDETFLWKNRDFITVQGLGIVVNDRMVDFTLQNFFLTD